MKGESRERFLRYFAELQQRINILASVAIEYPALRAHPLLHLDDEEATTEEASNG
jgi:hypothetical protein